MSKSTRVNFSFFRPAGLTALLAFLWSFQSAAQPRPLYTDSLIPVYIHPQWGYMDQQGNTVIPPQFWKAGFFDTFGTAVVELKPDSACILSANGQIFHPERKAQWLSRLNPWLFRGSVQDGPNFSGAILNQEGKLIGPPGTWIKTREILDNSGGNTPSLSLADYFVITQFIEDWQNKTRIKEEAIIDKKGNFIQPFTRQYSYEYLGEGIVIFSEVRTEFFGIMEVSGKILVPAQWELLEYYSPDEPFGRNSPLSAKNKNGNWGYLNCYGDTLLPFEYEKTNGYYEHIIVKRNDNHTRWRLTRNRQGQMIAKPAPPSEPLKPLPLVFYSEGGLLGVKNQKGKILLPPVYEISHFLNKMENRKLHVVLVCDTGDSRQAGIFREDGKWLFPMGNAGIRPLRKQLYELQMDGKKGYLNLKGKWVVPPEYDASSDYLPEGIFLLNKGDFTGWWKLAYENGEDKLPARRGVVFSYVRTTGGLFFLEIPGDRRNPFIWVREDGREYKSESR